MTIRPPSRPRPPSSVSAPSPLGPTFGRVVSFRIERRPAPCLIWATSSRMFDVPADSLRAWNGSHFGGWYRPTTGGIGVKQIVVSRRGGPDVLTWVQADRPEPEPGQVRVQVLAAGVSAFDLIYRRWARLPGSPKVPFTLGGDVAGVVDKPGPGVSALESARHGQRGVSGARPRR